MKQQIEAAIEEIEGVERSPEVYRLHEQRMTEIREYLASRGES